MPKVTLLTNDSATKSTTLFCIPLVGEYIFYDNETMLVNRVIHIPKMIGTKAVVSVNIIKSHE